MTTIRELAVENGTSQGQVITDLLALGVDVEQQIVDALTTGTTLAQVGDALGIHNSILSEIVMRRGVDEQTRAWRDYIHHLDLYIARHGHARSMPKDTVIDGYALAGTHAFRRRQFRDNKLTEDQQRQLSDRGITPVKRATYDDDWREDFALFCSVGETDETRHWSTQQRADKRKGILADWREKLLLAEEFDFNPQVKLPLDKREECDNGHSTSEYLGWRPRKLEGGGERVEPYCLACGAESAQRRRDRLRKALVFDPKQCPVCLEDFVPQNTSLQVYCTKACSGTAYWNRKKAAREIAKKLAA